LFDSDRSRKHTLECLRLKADCMQLAVETNSQSRASHFVRMAAVWSSLADSEPSDLAIRKTN